MKGEGQLGCAPFLLEAGGTAEIVEADGNRVVLASTAPSPPGSTLQGLLGGEGRPFRVKVRSCRRIEGDSASFRIEGRFVDLTREQRAAVAPPSTDD